MAECLSDETIAELKESFTLFSCDEEGKVYMKDLVGLLRFHGVNLSQLELDRFVQEYYGEEKNDEVVEFPFFLDLVARNGANLEDMIDACKVFDQHGNGYILETELRYILSSFNKPMTDEELSKLIREWHCTISPETGTGDGQIDYEEFIKTMIFK